MSGSHDHSHGTEAPETALWTALALTSGFLVVEVIGAFVTGSLALLSDAGHCALAIGGVVADPDCRKRNRERRGIGEHNQQRASGKQPAHG